MTQNDLNAENYVGDGAQRAVSLYRQDEGVDDFPVLKAFQQYIDAEQEKARKRILTLGIFFGVVLVIVIAVFMVLLHEINIRNQSLSDRLVEYAMNESSRRQNVPTDVKVQSDPALKTMAESIESLQRQLLSSQNSNQEQANSREAKEDAAKLQRAKALLEEEKKRLAAEKERLHQIEIEQQRRKLYPELYRDNEPDYVPFNGGKRKQQRTRTLTDDDIREIIREAYPDNAQNAGLDKPVKQSSPVQNKENAEDEKADEGAIEYFKDDDYTIPVEVKGKSSKVKFTVPVS